jgi:hypothetical protein
MPGFELREEFACGAGAPFPHIFAALADPFTGIVPGGDVKEALVRGGGLDDEFRFALHC